MTIGWVMVIFAILGCFFLMPIPSLLVLVVAFVLPFVAVALFNEGKALLGTAVIAGQGAGCYGIFVLVSEYPLDTDDAFMKAVLILLGLAALLLGWGSDA
jgi:hypothetical protein